MKKKRTKAFCAAVAGITLALVFCFTAVACKSTVHVWQPPAETDVNAYGFTAVDGKINFDYEEIPAETKIFFVSPFGNNANDGLTLKSAVYSVKQAQQRVRDYLAGGGEGNCAIMLDNGEYFLSGTMDISYSDVPQNGKLFIRSINPNGATISGSKRVDNLTVTEITDERLGRVWKIPCENGINQLYINEDYAIRARYPDVGEQLRLLNWDEVTKQIIIDKEDVKDFSDEELKGSTFVAEIMWAESYIRVGEVLRGEKTANVVPVPSDISVFSRSTPQARERQSYHLENSRAFLTARGEFWYSETEKIVYYLPYESETLDNTVIRIPQTEELLRVKGNGEFPIDGVNIEGVNFMYAGNTNIDGKIGNQANKDDGQNKRFAGTINDGRPYSAVTMEFVQNARIVGNKFACLGGGALDFTVGVQDTEVSKNLFRSVGGSGILSGVIHYSIDMVDTEEITFIKNLTIKDNYFTDIAWQEYGGCAICLNYCVNAKITKNTVTNTKYTGISVGWGWSDDAYPFLMNNEISYNRISCAINLMSDGSAIYLVGCQPDSKVFSNYIEYVYDSPWKYPNDMVEFWHVKWGLSAIYLDEGVGGTGEDDKVKVYNNYIYKGDVRHFFTYNAKTDEDLRPLFETISIEEKNQQSVKDGSGADRQAFREIYGKAKIFGFYVEDAASVTVFGEALDSKTCALILKGKNGRFTVLSANDVIGWAENEITFKTENYSSGEAFILCKDGTTSNRFILSLNVDVQYEKYDRFVNEWGGPTGLKGLLTDKMDLKKDGFNASSSMPGWPPRDIADGNNFTGWSADADDTDPWVSFELDGMSTIRKFVLYARDGEDQIICRKNFEIHGYDAYGNDLLLFTIGDEEAFPHGGALVINVEDSEYADRIFKSFKICRTPDNHDYLFVAEVAII